MSVCMYVCMYVCTYLRTYVRMYVNGEYATRYFTSGALEPKVGVATSENPISRHPSCTEAGIFLS